MNYRGECPIFKGLKDGLVDIEQKTENSQEEMVRTVTRHNLGKGYLGSLNKLVT